jgi:hypothetical protein
MNLRAKSGILAATLLALLVTPLALQAEDLSSAHQQALQDQGIPAYPGSTSTTSDDTEELTVLWFRSSDPPSKIMGWFREQLAGWSELESNGMAVLYKGPPGLEAKELGDKPYIFTRSTTESDPVNSEITIRLPKR